MTTTIIKGAEVSRPSTDPLKSSVLDHATVVENVQHFGLRNDAGMWNTYSGLDLLVPTKICPDPLTMHVYRTAPWVPGLTFALQGGVRCAALSLDVADQKKEVERVFGLNEGKGIEMALLRNRFIARADDPANPQDGSWPAPVNVTPVAAVPLFVALALLEGYAATAYAGIPTIHMTRAAGSLLGDKILWEGDKAFTRSGAKVAMGGGYDSTTVPMSNKWDLYATGEVYVERSESISIQTYVLPGDGSGVGPGQNQLEDNTVISLAERMYRVAIDGFVAKSTATVWA